MTGTIAAFYRAEAVLVTLGVTAGVTLAVTLFSMQTKIDFTKCGGLFFCLSMVLLLLGIAMVIVLAVTDPEDQTRRVRVGIGRRGSITTEYHYVFLLYSILDLAMLLWRYWSIILLPRKSSFLCSLLETYVACFGLAVLGVRHAADHGRAKVRVQ